MDFCGRIILSDALIVISPSAECLNNWRGKDKDAMQGQLVSSDMQLLHIMMMIFRILIIFESSAGGRRRYQITHHGMFLLVQPKHDSEVSSHHHLFQQCCCESIQSHHKHGCTINKSNFQSETFWHFRPYSRPSASTIKPEELPIEIDPPSYHILG